MAAAIEATTYILVSGPEAYCGRDGDEFPGWFVAEVDDDGEMVNERRDDDCWTTQADAQAHGRHLARQLGLTLEDESTGA